MFVERRPSDRLYPFTARLESGVPFLNADVDVSVPFVLWIAELQFGFFPYCQTGVWRSFQYKSMHLENAFEKITHRILGIFQVDVGGKLLVNDAVRKILLPVHHFDYDLLSIH